MNCEEAHRSLGLLLYDELAAEAHAEVSAHVVGCAVCAQSLEELRTVRYVLEAWEPVETGAAESAIAAALEAGDEPALARIEPVHGIASIFTMPRIVAAAALFSIIGIIVFGAEVRVSEHSVSIAFGRSPAPRKDLESDSAEKDAVISDALEQSIDERLMRQSEEMFNSLSAYLRGWEYEQMRRHQDLLTIISELRQEDEQRFAQALQQVADTSLQRDQQAFVALRQMAQLVSNNARPNSVFPTQENIP